ncbi:hypothetical protein VNO77_18629 [Canavalia gladiata]|uniref:Uncharacterized protein n=1 Tax=Canavalia gladiata TaxID=3824 RepID=A0AAN9LQ23_CANGL
MDIFGAVNGFKRKKELLTYLRLSRIVVLLQNRAADMFAHVLASKAQFYADGFLFGLDLALNWRDGVKVIVYESTPGRVGVGVLIRGVGGNSVIAYSGFIDHIPNLLVESRAIHREPD